MWTINIREKVIINHFLLPCSSVIRVEQPEGEACGYVYSMSGHPIQN